MRLKYIGNQKETWVGTKKIPMGIKVIPGEIYEVKPDWSKILLESGKWVVIEEVKKDIEDKSDFIVPKIKQKIEFKTE